MPNQTPTPDQPNRDSDGYYKYVVWAFVTDESGKRVCVDGGGYDDQNSADQAKL